MSKLREFLQGKRTFILVGLGVLAVVLRRQDVIDSETLTQVLAVLGFGTVATLRLAIRNLLVPVDKPPTNQSPPIRVAVVAFLCLSCSVAAAEVRFYLRHDAAGNRV